MHRTLRDCSYDSHTLRRQLIFSKVKDISIAACQKTPESFTQSGRVSSRVELKTKKLGLSNENYVVILFLLFFPTIYCNKKREELYLSFLYAVFSGINSSKFTAVWKQTTNYKRWAPWPLHFMRLIFSNSFKYQSFKITVYTKMIYKIHFYNFCYNIFFEKIKTEIRRHARLLLMWLPKAAAYRVPIFCF